MKYKIGNTEVEAVQWNSKNFGEIAELLLDVSEHNIKAKYNSEMNLYIGDQYIHKNKYIVISGESHFILSEQDFNNMATKVKEPKFKVGDKVYWPFNQKFCPSICVRTITRIVDGCDYLVDNLESIYTESELLTLEEAIEKLKEL